MELRTFSDLIAAASTQAEPQRLLLVFVAAGLPDRATDAQRAAYQRGEGGELTPVLCVDKAPDEIASFGALCEESQHAGIDWNFMFVGALSGKGGHAPNSDEAARPLRLMVDAIRGGRLAGLLAVDREGDLISLRAA